MSAPAPPPFQLIAAARVVASGFVEHAATHQAADTLAEGATADPNCGYAGQRRLSGDATGRLDDLDY
jgi:hypothetical protein